MSAVSLGCLMVKRANWLPLDEEFKGGLAAVDLGLRQRQVGKWFVFTPHAKAELLPNRLLLPGTERNAADVALFERKWGQAVHDPCYSERFGRKKADYHY